MFPMSNQAYLSIWCKDFPEDRILERFGNFLATVPFSTTKPEFTHLMIRAVDSLEPPLLEQDLRAVPLDSSGIVEIAKDHLHNDCSYEVRSHWDLWAFADDPTQWRLQAQPLEIFCHGEEFDEGFWQENGHLEVNFGFEHFFTGHGGLLAPGAASNPFASSDHPIEHTFRQWMSVSANLKEYHAKTRENIQQLFRWIEAVESALPVERSELWSEGEENFEARLDAIAAQR